MKLSCGIFLRSFELLHFFENMRFTNVAVSAPEVATSYTLNFLEGLSCTYTIALPSFIG